MIPQEKESRSGGNFSDHEAEELSNAIKGKLNEYRKATDSQVIDPLFYAAENSISVYRADLNDTSLYGYYAVDNQGKDIICYGKELDIKIMRFVLAHEIIHVILHRFSHAKDTSKVLDTCIKDDTFPQDSKQKRIEDLCNKWAREMLMPTAVFVNAYNLNKIQFRGKIGLVRELSRIFNLEEAVVEERITELNLG